MRTSFIDSSDGTRLRIAQWGAPSGRDGRRDLLLVHGYAEHAARYDHVGEALSARGWAVTLVELRGHGHSGGRRGHVTRWIEYADDLRAVSTVLRPGFSAIAHSMGGLAVLDALGDGFRPARIALSNPLLAVRFKAPALKIAAARLLSRVWPSLALKNELKPEWLSRDPAIGAAYAADTQVFDTVTARWYTEMLKAEDRVNALAALAVPVGMFVGADDQITDPAVNEAFARKVDAHFVAYPDHRHEIFNEIGKERAIAEVADWLEA